MVTQHRPNIVLICLGPAIHQSFAGLENRAAITPNLEKLAQQGVRFDACYVQNPASSPARASLLTGKYPRNHGLWANGVALPLRHDIFPRALADAGYDCAMIGRQHLAGVAQARTEPRRDNDGYRVFEWSHSPTNGSRQNAYRDWLRRKAPEAYVRIFPNLRQVGADDVAAAQARIAALPVELSHANWVAERAIAFIDHKRSAGEPFYVMANFAEMQPQADAKAGQAADLSAMQALTAQDAQIGRILATLEASEQADDTLVVFTAESGATQGPNLLSETATRVPLILRWRGKLPAGQIVTDLVQIIDITATILESAAVKRFAGVQGQSLLPLINGDTTGRGWALCEYRNSDAPLEPPLQATMFRRANAKLVVWHDAALSANPKAGELYDLATDPDEKRNLFAEPDCAALRDNMMDSLIDVLCAVEDRSQPRVPRPRLYVAAENVGDVRFSADGFAMFQYMTKGQ